MQPLIDAIERFEIARRVLGHSLVLNEQLSARLRKFAVAARSERDVLARYAMILAGLRAEEDWWSGMVGSQDRSTIPLVDLEAETIRHETCTGGTVITVVRDGDDWLLDLERPNGPLNPASGRDLALVWCGGGDASTLYPPTRMPTKGAVVEAIAILAMCALDDSRIAELALSAGYVIDTEISWQEIDRLRRPRYLLGFTWYWQAWLRRHPDMVEEPPTDEEVELWRAAQAGASRGAQVVTAAPSSAAARRRAASTSTRPRRMRAPAN